MLLAGFLVSMLINLTQAQATSVLQLPSSICTQTTQVGAQFTPALPPSPNPFPTTDVSYQAEILVLFSVTKAEVETDFVNGNLLVICHSRADNLILRTYPE